jgi:hypothetical protein
VNIRSALRSNRQEATTYSPGSSEKPSAGDGGEAVLAVRDAGARSAETRGGDGGMRGSGRGPVSSLEGSRYTGKNVKKTPE